jgi:eukaryotic-like serine/threonine-protein kinase
MAAKKFGKYELLAKLGQGGMGAVYQARDPVLDRMVALKVVSPKLLAEPDTFARFQREARAAARLQHPNIVTIYELGEAEGTLYIAMELLDGTDLAQIIQPLAPGRIEEKVRMVSEVCRGLEYAHKRGVVHRDVKPANVRVLNDGSVKVVDFGIAHVAGSTLTQAGMVLGTPSYLAPEVIASGRVDHRADIWSVGVMMYEILTGTRPYDSPEFSRVLYRIMHEPLPPLAPDLALPEGLEGIMRKALVRDPGRRYQDLAEMGRDLQAVIGRGWASETPVPPDARQRAFEELWQEAQAQVAGGDLERALEAACQAQALDPGRPEIVALVDEIYDRLAGTFQPPTPTAAPASSRIAVSRASAAPPVAPPPPSPPVARPTTPMGSVHQRGASAFRELATFGESPATRTAALCPTWPLFAIAGSDGAIRLWDLLSQRRVQILRTELHQRAGHDAIALALAFSPDGALLASGHVDGSIHLWHLASAQEYPIKMRHDDIVGALAFSPDGKTLASGGMDSNLKFWDVAGAVAGDARRELHRQPSAVTAIAYAPAGGWIVTGHPNRVLRLSDPKTGRLIATMRGPEGQVHLICPAPDGTKMAVASQDRTIRFFDVGSREQIFVLAGSRRPTTSLAFFADGIHFVTVAQDNAVQLWDMETQSAVASLWGLAEDSFTSVAVYGEDLHIVVALSDGRIRVWGPA